MATMLSKKEAVLVYQHAGLEVWQRYAEELMRFAEQSGSIPLPDLNPVHAKVLWKAVKRSGNATDAVKGPALIMAVSLRDSTPHPLVALMRYEQALTVLRVLALSRFGESPELDSALSELVTDGPRLLGLE